MDWFAIIGPASLLLSFCWLIYRIIRLTRRRYRHMPNLGGGSRRARRHAEMKRRVTFRR